MNNTENSISRRSVIKILGVGTLGAITLFSGIKCSQTSKNELESATIVGVTTRKDNTTSADISLLGFGMMRLPIKDEFDKSSINEELASEMVDYAYKNGVNFFDTAWFYHQGKSEPFTGKTLSKYNRESYYLSTKMPIGVIDGVDPNGLVTATEPLDRAKEIFNLQLKRCNTDYIDFYMLHSLRSLEQFQNVFLGYKVLDFVAEQKKNGVIKRLGFSFHGANSEFPLILDAFPWDFVMIQINYFD